MSELGIYIDEATDVTPALLRSRARQLVKKEGIGLLVVDYMQLMGSDGKHQNRDREISEISRACKFE